MSLYNHCNNFLYINNIILLFINIKFDKKTDDNLSIFRINYAKFCPKTQEKMKQLS